MIGRLRGILLEKHPPSLLLDVQGVGYNVEAPMSTFYRLGSLGDEVTLHIHFVVREDAQLLYGFSSQEERHLFRSLLKVNGVGPKMALAILSGMEADAFVQCIQHADVATLTRIPGVGKKTAERLVVEMKDRLSPLPVAAGSSAAMLMTSSMVLASPVQEAVSALVALGYKPVDAEKVVAGIRLESPTTEELIRHALRSMVR